MNVKINKKMKIRLRAKKMRTEKMKKEKENIKHVLIM